MQNILDDLDAAIESFTVPLRMGDGFDEENFQKLYAILRTCAETWADSDSIPKRAAVELFGLSSSIEACGYLYEGDAARRAKDAASTIYALTLEILADKQNQAF